jgi:tetratricopeptide (TPR) repeat protein
MTQGKATQAAETGEGLAVKPASVRWTTLLPALAIVAAGFWIYWPALHGDWLWDDDLLVTGNPNLHGLHGLLAIWLTAPTTDYWPLTWTFLWFEWHLWGAHPFGYHLCSLALHIISGFLIWRLFSRLGLRGGWIGGLLFVVHPLAVESVAWIAEIKNTLSLPFFLLSFDAWLDVEEGKPLGYRRSVLFYLAAMLAKTSTVMLPASLLLYCWWKRGRVTRQEIMRLLPYLGIALVLGLITIYFQDNGGEVIRVEPGGVITRSIGAGTAFFFYLGKFLLPIGLLPVYPHWTLSPPTVLQVMTLPALAALFLGLWTQRQGWGRHALFGLGFFLLNALPILGLLKMRYMAFSWVADHLVYLPMIGLVGLVVAAWNLLRGRAGSLFYILGAGAMAVVLALFLGESHRYAGRFINAETLCLYTLPHNPDAPMLHDNLGVALMKRGRLADAIDQFNLTLKVVPDFAEAHVNLGEALQKSDRISEAIGEYGRAAKLAPDFADAYYKWGVALVQAGRPAEAIEPLGRSLKLNPDNAEAHNNLGVALIQTGRASEAIEHFRQAIRIKPDDAQALANLARAEASPNSDPPATR